METLNTADQPSLPKYFVGDCACHIWIVVTPHLYGRLRCRGCGEKLRIRGEARSDAVTICKHDCACHPRTLAQVYRLAERDETPEGQSPQAG